jgi:hypothetical protein
LYLAIELLIPVVFSKYPSLVNLPWMICIIFQYFHHSWLGC